MFVQAPEILRHPSQNAKLDTMALYARIAITTIRAVMSPLDRLGSLAKPNRKMPERRPPRASGVAAAWRRSPPAKHWR
jgi:hypothetical protein